MSVKPARRRLVQVDRFSLAHYVRVTRDENRLTNQVYEDTPFGAPVEVESITDNYRIHKDSVKVTCGDSWYIYERKELTQWK